MWNNCRSKELGLHIQAIVGMMMMILDLEEER